MKDRKIEARQKAISLVKEHPCYESMWLLLCLLDFKEIDKILKPNI